MRSFLIGTMAMVALTTLATTGSAQEPAAKVATTRPKIEVAPTVRIVGFHRSAMNAGPYVGGSLGVAVDIENTTGAAMEGISVKLAVDDKVLETTVTLTPHTTRAATFIDSTGLASSCKPKTYKISLAGPGTGNASREATVTPSCTFTSTIEQTWNQMTPDHVEAEKAGNAYLTAASVVSAPACGKGPTLKVRIVDNSAMSSPSLVVQAKEWSATAPVKAQTAAAFPIAAHEQKDLLLTPVAGSANAEPSAKMKLAIVDWTKSLGGHTSDGGIFVNTTRSCTLDFALE